LTGFILISGIFIALIKRVHGSGSVYGSRLIILLSFNFGTKPPRLFSTSKADKDLIPDKIGDAK